VGATRSGSEVLERLRVQPVPALQALHLVDELARWIVCVEVVDELLERVHGSPTDASS
jgi:hypothetical protein